MIINNIDNLKSYSGILSGVDGILEFITRSKRENLNPGRYFINDYIKAIIQEYKTKEESDCKWESHIKYMDIQFIERGEEKMRYADTQLMDISQAYNEEKDIIFYNRPQDILAELKVIEGFFAVFFPSDAHQPCCMSGIVGTDVRKIVFKILI